MMALPQRVVLITGGRLSLMAGTFAVAKWTFPAKDNPADPERQIDDHVLSLIQSRRRLRLHAKLTTDGKTFDAEFNVQNGRFYSVRKCVAQAYVARAHSCPLAEYVLLESKEQDSLLEQARHSLRKAERLDGQPRTDLDLPVHYRTKPQEPKPALTVPFSAHDTRIAPTGYCPYCGQRVPRLRAYHNGIPGPVFQLHCTKPDRTNLCKGILQVWALLDARPLQPMRTPAPETIPDLMERSAWLHQELAAVPTDLGGPLDRFHTDLIRLYPGGAQ